MAIRTVNLRSFNGVSRIIHDQQFCHLVIINRINSALSNSCFISTNAHFRPPMQRSDGGSENWQEARKSHLKKVMSFVREKTPDFISPILRLNAKNEPADINNHDVGTVTVLKPQVERITDRVHEWYKKYQDFVGISDLQKAQDKVTMLTESLLEAQRCRRQLQSEIENLQEKLLTTHQRITKTELYSEEHYKLFEEARDVNTSLKLTRSEFVHGELHERETFTQLSSAIRDCHERERTQAEQSKYWSIIFSVVSAAIASVITSLNNWVRIREIKDHVSMTTQQLVTSVQEMRLKKGEVAGIGVTKEDIKEIEQQITNLLTQRSPAESPSYVHIGSAITFGAIVGMCFVVMIMQVFR